MIDYTGQKAEYSVPITRSLVVCQYCYDTFGGNCNCVECMKPITSITTILDIFVGVNHDRANIEFDDGSVKNVSVNTLRLIRKQEGAEG